MVLKALFLIIILYYVVRTVRSLLRAVRNDGAGPGRSELNREPGHSTGWQGPSNGHSKAAKNVEDAKWVDL